MTSDIVITRSEVTWIGWSDLPPGIESEAEVAKLTSLVKVLENTRGIWFGLIPSARTQEGARE